MDVRRRLESLEASSPKPYESVVRIIVDGRDEGTMQAKIEEAQRDNPAARIIVRAIV
jgi:hypothetical protein